MPFYPGMLYSILPFSHSASSLIHLNLLIHAHRQHQRQEKFNLAYTFSNCWNTRYVFQTGVADNCFGAFQNYTFLHFFNIIYITIVDMCDCMIQITVIDVHIYMYICRSVHDTFTLYFRSSYMMLEIKPALEIMLALKNYS